MLCCSPTSSYRASLQPRKAERMLCSRRPIPEALQLAHRVSASPENGGRFGICVNSGIQWHWPAETKAKLEIRHAKRSAVYTGYSSRLAFVGLRWSYRASRVVALLLATAAACDGITCTTVTPLLRIECQVIWSICATLQRLTRLLKPFLILLYLHPNKT